MSETLFIAASRAGISVARQAGESWNVEALASAPELCLATDEDCHHLAGTGDRVFRSDDGGRTRTASGLRGLSVTGIARRQGLVPDEVWRRLTTSADVRSSQIDPTEIGSPVRAARETSAVEALTRGLAGRSVVGFIHEHRGNRGCRT